MKLPTWKKTLSTLLSSTERLWGRSSRVIVGATLASLTSLVASAPADANPLTPRSPDCTIEAGVSKYAKKFVLKQAAADDASMCVVKPIRTTGLIRQERLSASYPPSAGYVDSFVFVVPMSCV